MSADFIPFVPPVKQAAQGAFAPMALPVKPEPTPAPKIEVKRSGGRITHIIVRCGCGEVTEIECEYNGG
jgi:hypothetical protein